MWNVTKGSGTFLVALLAIASTVLLSRHFDGSLDLSSYRFTELRGYNDLVTRAEPPRCSPLCNSHEPRKKSKVRRSSFLPWASPAINKRYEVLADSNAIDDHLRNEVPKLDAASSAYHESRDANRGWSAIKQPLKGAKQIVRVGTEGLVGCNVVVAISDQEVWMAHFVEDRGFSGKSLDKPHDYQRQKGYIDFQKNVIAGISGPATKYPTIKSEERRLNPKLGGERTRPRSLTVWIITGKLDGKMQYPKEVEAMQAEIKKTLEMDADPEYHLYEVTDGKDPRFETEALGQVLFEYDPNNNGQKSWRLLVHNDLVEEGTFA
ncbi:MAG: hypothetical protein Q9169_003084 [Polycauliona sp. 2 TL-2023]